MDNIDSNETAAPETKPDVKPSPERQAPERTRPRRDDPWTVPGPKVKPTPKA